MEVYAVVRQYEKQSETIPAIGMTIEDVEARYAGTGLGQKTLADVCRSVQIGITNCVERLSVKGFDVATDEKLKQVAESYEINPMDVLKMLLVTDYLPKD